MVIDGLVYRSVDQAILYELLEFSPFTCEGFWQVNPDFFCSGFDWYFHCCHFCCHIFDGTMGFGFISVFLVSGIRYTRVELRCISFGGSLLFCYDFR